jgi:SAM-dependent methyltransferase
MKNGMSGFGDKMDRPCIVCESLAAGFFAAIDGKSYRRCSVCQAIFLDPDDRLPPAEEYARYCRHQNNPDDDGYRRFLAKLADPLLQRLPARSKGLDYGCGPGPALAHMLRGAGHRVSLFDPHFFPDPEPLDDLYDFITCSETIEHFHHPLREFAGFDRMLQPGGLLAVMTCFQTEAACFASWHYRRDPTHVVFYREATLRHIARRFGWKCEIPAHDVAMMRNP